jgi:hypothetical protein
MDIYILICVCVLSIFIFLHTHIYIFMYTCVCLLILPMSNLEFSNEKIIPTIYAICWFALENIVLPFLRTRFLILDEWFDFQSRPRAFLVKVLESKKNLKNLEFWCHTIASLVLQPIRQTIVWLLIFLIVPHLCMNIHMHVFTYVLSSIYLSICLFSIYLSTYQEFIFSLMELRYFSSPFYIRTPGSPDFLFKDFHQEGRWPWLKVILLLPWFSIPCFIDKYYFIT